MLNVSMTLVESLGAAALATGIVILLFSPYRRWLGYMLAGMVYFVFLEGTQTLLNQGLGWSMFEGYLTGIGLSVIGLMFWLGATEEQRSARRRAEWLASQVEHRPVSMDELQSPSRR